MIEINGKVYRNLQEQVEKNAEDIAELGSSITGFDEELDKKVNKDDFGYIYLDSPSGTLTDEQFAECLKEYCVIDYQTNENVISRYYKLSQSDYPIISSGTISFNRCWFGSTESRTDSQGRAYRRVQQFVISVNRSTKAYTVSTEGLYDIYNKSNIDTLMANLPVEGVGSITVEGVEGTLSDDDYNAISNNDISAIIKDGLMYYRYDVDSARIYFKTIPTMSYISAQHLNYFEQRTITVVKATKKWSDANTGLAMPVTDRVYKYQVYFEFTKTGTGAGIYSVYFKVESTENYGSAMTFSQLRDIIHANGDRVQCTCQTSYSNSLDFNLVMQSTNADYPTILIDSKSADFFEFYSFSDLIDYSITPLQY